MKKLAVFVLVFFLVISTIPFFVDTAKAVWWDDDFQSYVHIYIKQENILSHDIYDFPVLLVINSTLAQHCDNGNSIRFLSIDNSTEYDYEIERWNNTGDSYIWVKIPIVKHNENTHFLMYYNNSGVTDNQNPLSVWSNNFTAVWHFNESSGTIHDSLGNYNLTNSGATHVENSIIGGGYYFNGVDSCLTATGFTPNDIGTLSFLTKRACSSCGRMRFAGGKDNFEVVARPDNLLTNHLFVLGSGTLTGRTLADINNYHHLGFTWNYTNYLNKIFMDGEKEGYGYLADDDPGSNFNFEIGHSQWYVGEFYDGTIDEFRISSIDRDRNWSYACYENQINPTNFTVWSTPQNQADVPPEQYNEVPTNGGSSDIIPTVFITVDDDFGRDLDAYFYSNSSGTWQLFGSNLSINVSTGAVILDQLGINFTVYNKTYWWRVCVTNGNAWNNKTYSFATKIGDEPWVFDFYPLDNATGVNLPVSLGVRVVDINGHKMEIVFYTNATGTWETIGTINDVYDGTYWVYGSSFGLYNHTYYWKVKVTDEIGLTNTTVYARTFKFTTSAYPGGACNKMCDSNNDTYIYFIGVIGIFGLFALAFYNNKNNNNKE